MPNTAPPSTDDAPSADVWVDGPATGEPKDLLSARFDYAWKWFDFHARQRMQLFNFFLIITGVAATAFASAYEKDLHFINLAVSSVGVVSAIGFIIFDIRSRGMTRRAEDILHELEQKQLFIQAPDLHGREPIPGPMSAEDGRRMREGWGLKRGLLFFFKMKTWIRLIEFCVLAAFIAGLVITIGKL